MSLEGDDYEGLCVVCTLSVNDELKNELFVCSMNTNVVNYELNF